MRKHLTVVAALALLVGSACQDSSVGPGGSTIFGGPSSASLTALGSSPATSQFTILPSGSRITVAGLFTVNFPANSVCDPAISGRCVPITAPVVVTATVQSTNGRLWVDFSPHLEFVNGDRKTWVTISTDIYAGFLKANATALRANRSLLKKHGLLYASAIGAPAIDEARATGDRSLVTRINFSKGLIWRRILHFSGYNIWTGERCDPSPDDPYCVEVEPEPEEDEDDGEGSGGPQ